MDNPNIIAYTIYLIACVFITVIVGKSLHKNGYPLILALFQHEAFTKTINNILLIGYYLVNLGYIARTIKQFNALNTVPVLLEELSYHMGFILILLGILHLNNILTLTILSKWRTRIIHFFNN